MTLELAGRLVDLRKKQGLSQEALGEKLGVSRQTISKWERGEASPDTDNLIALADLYGISLDELAGKARTTAKKKESVHVGFDGIHVENEEESVHIGPGGIHVETPTESCHLGPHEARRQACEVIRRGGKTHVFDSAVHLVLIAAYLCLGFFWNLWHPGWLILLLGPILTSFAAAIRQRSARRFAWPVVVIAAYLCLGFFWNLWHPGWVVFLSVPLYYMIAGLFAKGKDCRAPEAEPVAQAEKEE